MSLLSGSMAMYTKVKDITTFYNAFNDDAKYPYLVIPDELLNIQVPDLFELINEYSCVYRQKLLDERPFLLSKERLRELHHNSFMRYDQHKREDIFDEILFSRKFDDYMLDYLINLEEWEKKVNKFGNKIKDFAQGKFYTIVRENGFFLNTFTEDNVLYPTKINKPIKKSIAEGLFFKILKHQLSNIVLDVFIDYELKSDNSLNDNNYIPDIIIRTSRGLLIDIEIDEPYTLETGLPIHYTGADTQRDDFFKNNNWCVIRFAEEQVLNHPYHCVSFILELIVCLDFSSSYWKIRDNVSGFNMPMYYKWTMNEARKLQMDNFRENYFTDNKDWLIRYNELDINCFEENEYYGSTRCFFSDYEIDFSNSPSEPWDFNNNLTFDKKNSSSVKQINLQEGPTDDLPW